MNYILLKLRIFLWHIKDVVVFTVSLAYLSPTFSKSMCACTHTLTHTQLYTMPSLASLSPHPTPYLGDYSGMGM